MEENIKKQDRRIIKSKKAIKKAFMSILATKDINDITIKNIADLADVDRKTVYNYYNGTYEILNEIENENLIKGEEDINSEKTKENENSQIIKTCKKMKIISIKRDITIASDKFKSMEISFDKTKKKIILI